MRDRLRAMRRILAIGKNRAEHARVQRLDAPVEERWEPRELADVERLDTVRE